MQNRNNRFSDHVARICLALAIIACVIVFIGWKVRSANKAGVSVTSRSPGNTCASNAVYRDVSLPLKNLSIGSYQSNVVANVASTEKNHSAQHSTFASVEQSEQGSSAPPDIVASFDGIGEGFEGPQGSALLRNPSDNSLAVGKDHIVQIVNTRMAVFTKKGKKYSETGKALYGPVPANVFFPRL